MADLISHAPPDARREPAERMHGASEYFLHWIAQAPTRVAFCSPEEPCAVTNLNKGTRTCRRVDKLSYPVQAKKRAGPRILIPKCSAARSRKKNAAPKKITLLQAAKKDGRASANRPVAKQSRSTKTPTQTRKRYAAEQAEDLSRQEERRGTRRLFMGVGVLVLVLIGRVIFWLWLSPTFNKS